MPIGSRACSASSGAARRPDAGCSRGVGRCRRRGGRLQRFVAPCNSTRLGARTRRFRDPLEHVARSSPPPRNARRAGSSVSVACSGSSAPAARAAPIGTAVSAVPIHTRAGARMAPRSTPQRRENSCRSMTGPAKPGCKPSRKLPSSQPAISGCASSALSRAPRAQRRQSRGETRRALEARAEQRQTPAAIARGERGRTREAEAVEARQRPPARRDRQSAPSG